MDVRHEDVLVMASLIPVDREAEADGHQLVPGEAAGGRVAQHRAGVLVGVLPPSSCSRMLHFFTCPLSLF